MTLLSVEHINVAYGDVQIINDLSLTVEEGEVVSIIGGNGAGKSTLLKAISGLVPPTSGVIRFRNEPVQALPPEKIVERGLVHVPEGRRLFSLMTVAENLDIGAFNTRAYKDRRKTLHLVYEMLPRLLERQTQLAMTLSGGEAMMQHEFATALLREAHKHHINTTIETCGCYPYEHLHEACKHLDKLIFDIKSLDPVLHKKHTGVDNMLIMRNFARVVEDFPQLPILARTPVIPGFNDTEDDILAIRESIPRRPNIEFELLAYHRMGQPKYGYLGREYELEGAKLDEEKMQHLRDIAS